MNTLRLGLGRVFEDAGRYQRALEHYDEMLRTESERDPRIINRLSWFLLTTDSQEHRDLDRGMKLATQAAEATTYEYPNVLDTLAEAYLQKGDMAKAIELLRKCVDLDPSREYFESRLKELGVPIDE